MLILLTILHVFVCFFLVVVVLLQSGKAADLAGAFGGMGSQTAFGPRGAATILSKATTIAAVAFMLTSMTLAIIATRSSGVGSTVLEGHQPATQTAPAGPPAQPAGTPGAVPEIPIELSTEPASGQPSSGQPAGQQAPAQPQK